MSDPIRLRIVSELNEGGERACGAFNLPITKSTCSHHFRVLREAGVISTRVAGKSRINVLRREALEDRFPGLLDAILHARSD
ncbi:MAG TPA: winged helix-turn-helix domain-containing protein [Solirubrobacteraceae bacterium]|nr:winged helix-turn-helix domain-containing protein [Solirubrobacteraceae bacterium]